MKPLSWFGIFFVASLYGILSMTFGYDNLYPTVPVVLMAMVVCVIVAGTIPGLAIYENKLSVLGRVWLAFWILLGVWNTFRHSEAVLSLYWWLLPMCVAILAVIILIDYWREIRSVHNNLCDAVDEWRQRRRANTPAYKLWLLEINTSHNGLRLIRAALLLKRMERRRGDAAIGEARTIIEDVISSMYPNRSEREACYYRATLELDRELENKLRTKSRLKRA